VNVAVMPQRVVATVSDVRPLIQRNQTNLWTQAEQIRDGLYEQFSRVCSSMQIEPLLLSSGPYVYPAWVKFEAWQPVDQPTTTRRSSVVVEIDPKPYHEHQFEFSVTYTAQKASRRVKRVRPLSDDEVRALVEYLLRGGPKPKFRHYRNLWFQFWRPHNKVQGLKRDGLGIAMMIALVGGFAFTAIPMVTVGAWALAALLFWVMHRRKAFVRNDGKPDSEPRTLVRVDSWQTVLFNLGRDVSMVRDRLLHAFQIGLSPQCRFRAERLWYWGLDGKEEREQFVLTGGRGIVFCQIYRYGEDLYVGWDGHLNRGQWVEQTVTSGIDRASGDPVTVTRVVPGTQPTNEYDLADLSCLMEWTHAQIVKVLKQLTAERKIDQEIDFKIQRAERQQVVASGAASAQGDRVSGLRKTFQRTA
jgi:hypothetical protein